MEIIELKAMIFDTLREIESHQATIKMLVEAKNKLLLKLEGMERDILPSPILEKEEV